MENNMGMNRPQDKCIHHLFEEQVEQIPDVVAVVCEGNQLSYAELNWQADHLARALQGLGVGPETLIGLCVDRSIEMAVGVLGILKAGGAYVPMDPQYPRARLNLIQRNAGLKIILTAGELFDEWLCADNNLEVLDICAAIWAEKPQDDFFIPPDYTFNQLAYVLHTSGSTGIPKGVMIEHRNVLALLHAFEQIAPHNEKLVGTSVCPLGFDVSVWEFFSALCFGGTLHILLLDDFADAKHFARHLVDHAITSTYIPPALLSDVVSELEKQTTPIALNRILVGVEPIEQGILQRFRDLSNQMHIVNGYGPTETTVCATFFDFRDASSHKQRTPIGTAVPGYEVYIANQDLQSVLSEETGEVLVSGAGLGRGYLGQPRLTAERFIPNPFSDKPGTRMYRTGDLAHYLPDGNIEFIGRVDHQVKLRGFRIELGEIEAALSQHPAIAKSVVMAYEVAPGDKRLVAYVASGQEQTLTAGEMHNFLKGKLPDYMLPSAFVLLETLPLTPNGKVDRRALPVPGATRPELERAYVAPSTPSEEMLVGIWTEVLGVERIGVQDNFFELGGHSLLATQVISRVRDVLQVELLLRHLFETPTIAGLAETIKRIQCAGSIILTESMTSIDRDGDLWPSFAQERLWILDQLEPNNPVYNIALSYRLPGPLNIAALERGLNEIVRRHEVLRTTFAVVDERPVQVIAQAMSLALPIVDLRGLPEAEREVEAQRLATEEARRPFNLSLGPLFRATLLRLDSQDHMLLLTMHHIISDGWSIGVFNRELGVLYEAFSAGKLSPLSELPIQYVDFAHWQRQWLKGETLEAQLAFWKEHLGGELPILELLTDRPRPPVQTFRGARQFVMVPQTLIELLKALSRREGATLFMTLLAAFKTLLYRYTGQENIVVGSPIANRNRAEVEGLIGFFVNTLALRTDLSGDLSFRDLLSRVREVTLGAYTHQDLPFERLVEVLQPERDLSHNPLFQVVFALQTIPMEALVLLDSKVTPVVSDNETAKFDLTLELWERPDGLWGQLEYSTDLFDTATIKRLLEHFQTLLESVVTNPNQRLSRLPLLTEGERQQLLAEWNDTEIGYLRDRCVHELFEFWVEKSPRAIAVTFENQQLTYWELNRRANQLAHYLQGLGVGPEVLVSVYMERSLEMVVGILGILKAGGAYVPLDPTYPKERVAFMLEDTQSPVLLTQQRLVESLPKYKAHIACLDTGWEAIAGESEKNPTSRVTADNLAYVIYTSGSTGRPRGVQIDHLGLLNLIFWHQRIFDVSQADRAMQVAGPAFDASVWELWPYLTAGASVHIADNESRFSPVQLRDSIVAEEITISFLPTPLAESVLSLDWPDSVALRTLLTGGDKLSHYPFSSLPFELVNNYGPTESTVVTTSGLVLSQGRSDRPPHIGRPIANTQVYLLDSHLEPVPIGVPGELHIGGVGLARGYLNRLGLTAAKFIPDPFSDRPGARLYRTGDLVRYLPDGNIEFLGRIDHQVKIRGFRIELGEIEILLRQHTTVKEAIVLARQDPPGDERLVAYIVLEDTQTSTVSELRRFLEEKLPDYMIPSAFVALETMPLTPNGKVDRRALPAPDRAHLGLCDVFTAPRTPVEEKLAEIWTKLLGLEKISIHNNFFDLGGHSLLAAQLLSRVREAFHVELPLRSLFETPTVARLATKVTQNQAEQGSYEEVVHILQELEGLSEEEVQAMLKS